MSDKIIAEYSTLRPLYDECQRNAVELVSMLLEHAEITVHSVTGRTKAEASLVEKVKRPGKSYEQLQDITDLAGIRVIVYFPDDVDRVAQVLGQEFAVDEKLSVDKRVETPTNSFGYQSLHLIAQISNQRTQLPEYELFRDIDIEIQVRTVLQHTWAEIEHDLGYKATADVPRPLRRRFSKLSALLELADDEFQRIRDELSDYADEIEADIQENPNEADLDVVSLSKLVSQSPVVKNVAQHVQRSYGISFGGSRGEKWLNGLPQALEMIGAVTIGDVQDLLTKYENDVVTTWDIVFDLNAEGKSSLGMVLFALVLVATVLETAEGEASRLFRAFRICPDPDFEKNVRERLAD